MLNGLFLKLLGITIGLPLIDGAVRFTQVPQPILYVPDGGTARFIWNYHVDDRNSEFFTTSPEWYYSNSTGKTRIAADAVSIVSGRWKWNWYVSPSCPARLKHRLRKESVATLVISNVSKLDNGNYSCELVLRGGQNLRSSSQLIVTGAIPSPFTKVPPSVLYVVSGEDAKMVWNYSVSDRDTEFGGYSPAWYYYTDTSRINIANEYKWGNPKWRWSVAPTCPDRLKGRIRKESTATLVISNVTTADNGMYKCELTFVGGRIRSTNTTLHVIAITPKPHQTSITTSTLPLSVTRKSSTIPLSVARNATPTSSGTSIPKNQSNSAVSSCTPIIAACVTIIVILVAVVIFLIIYIWKGREQLEVTTRKRSFSNDKSMDLEAYENADQMDDVSNKRVHDTPKQKQVGKELYETVLEDNIEDANTQTHLGTRTLAADETPSKRQEPGPQHYQELTNLQHTPLYEPLDKRNASNIDDLADVPKTYQQLNLNAMGRDYQSLQNFPKKEDSNV